MAYQALYRKYRPQTFSDVVGQEHITETLKNELSGGKTVHAYLFTGTRGTGKTSCAKILAKAINCQNPQNGDPCLKCASCKAIAEGENTDIVEIDAASNNSVDSIRELRDQVAFAPANSKYRVYIIDEVHMLTLSAFNALLKTLEEPPKHVVFILATTEVHKLPATILSRCQRFDFKRIDTEVICARIQYIAEKEGLTVTDNAATLIASAADGGMRDALSILDLCASSNQSIDENTVESVCAMAGNDYLLKLADYIKAHDVENALLLLDALHNNSIDMSRLLSELIAHYRNLMVIKTVKSKNPPIICSKTMLEHLKTQADGYDIKDIMFALQELQASTVTMQTGNRRCEMEMTVIKLCNPSLASDLQSLDVRITALENKIKGLPSAIPPSSIGGYDKKTEMPDNIPTDNEIDEEPPLPPEPEFDNNRSVPIAAPSKTSEGNEDGLKPVDRWNDIIKILRTSCPLIAAVLTDSKAYIKGSYLLIDAPNSQFRSMINSGNSQYKDCIRKAAFTVLGETYKLGPYSAVKKTDEADPLKILKNKLENFKIN